MWVLPLLNWSIAVQPVTSWDAPKKPSLMRIRISDQHGKCASHKFPILRLDTQLINCGTACDVVRCPKETQFDENSKRWSGPEMSMVSCRPDLFDQMWIVNTAINHLTESVGQAAVGCPCGQATKDGGKGIFGQKSELSFCSQSGTF
jgi:hypothetical protein